MTCLLILSGFLHQMKLKREVVTEETISEGMTNNNFMWNIIHVLDEECRDF